MPKFKASSEHTRNVLRELHKHYPDSECALIHQNPLQLLVATMLSAQCTDVLVNQVTPLLFRKFPDAYALAGASIEDIETSIQRVNYFHTKAKHIKEAAQIILDEHDGNVPDTMEELVKLPGVARKTANVVLGNGYGKPEGIVVDTHVQRLSLRMGFTTNKTPTTIEADLMEQVPKGRWVLLSHQLIDHGRAICKARRPLCDQCPVEEICPKIGV